MAIRIEIEGHPPMEFPDGTDQTVIQSKVKELTGGDQTPQQDSVPEATKEQHGASGTWGTGASGSFKKTALDTLKEEGPAAVGATALAMGVGATGVGLPLVVGAAALGGAGGEAWKQIGQRISGSLSAPKTSIEAAKGIGKAGAEQGAWELVGGLAWMGASKVMAPFKGRVTEGVIEAKQFFGDRIKPLFLPAEATESRTLDLLQNIGESSIIGGNTIAKYKAKRSQFFDDFADNLIAQFGERIDPTDLGNLFVSTLENKKAAHKAATEVLYNNVSDMVGTITIKKKVTELVPSTIVGPNGQPAMKSVEKMVDETVDTVTVPTKGIKDFAKSVAVRSKDLGSIEAKNAGDDLISAIMDMPDQLGFDAARELRSRLISRVDEFSIANKKAPAIGKAKRMISMIDEGISNSLKKYDSVNPDSESAHEAWRLANRFYKEGQERLNNTMIRRIVKFADDTGTGAEMIAPAMFKPGQVSRVKAVKKAVDGPTWKKLQGFFMENFLQKSTDVNGEIIGKRVVNNISGKPGSYGEEMMREVLTPEQLNSLKQFGRAVQLTQERQSEGAGRMLIQLTQAGAIGTIAMGKAKPLSTVIIIGPAVLSKMMINPTMNKMLIEGMKMPVGSREAAAMLTRITASYTKTQMEEDQ